MKWLYCNINEISESERAHAYSLMHPSKRARVDRLKKADARIRSVCAHALAMRLLMREFGVTDPVIGAYDSGQPYVDGHGIFISISHSGDFVAAAASHTPVGIDIECPRDFNAHLLERVCTDDELSYVTGGEQSSRFYEIWTGKEAYFKMLGTGITDLKSVNVLTLPREFYKKDGCFIHIINKC